MNKKEAIKEAEEMYLKKDYSLEAMLESFYCWAYNSGFEDGVSKSHSESELDVFNL